MTKTTTLRRVEPPKDFSSFFKEKTIETAHDHHRRYRIIFEAETVSSMAFSLCTTFMAPLSSVIVDNPNAYAAKSDKEMLLGKLIHLFILSSQSQIRRPPCVEAKHCEIFATAE